MRGRDARVAVPASAPGSDAALTRHEPGRAALRSLEMHQVLVPRADSLRLVTGHTRLLSDLANRRALSGDVDAACAAREGRAGLMQLFEKGTQDRKELEVLICAALRERRVMAFTSSEMLVDDELVRLFGEADRRESVRRVDIYIIEAQAPVTFEAYCAACGDRAAQATLFKHAHALGLVCGGSVKSDFGLTNRRTSSGELHLDHCPLLFLAIPRVNEIARTLSDVVVCVNVCPHFPVTGAGKVCYVGSQPMSATAHNYDETGPGRRLLTTVDQLQ
jgi:hypothetical protein